MNLDKEPTPFSGALFFLSLRISLFIALPGIFFCFVVAKAQVMDYPADPAAWSIRTPLREISMPSESPYRIPLKFHIIIDGTANNWYSDSSYIDKDISLANKAFGPANIEFFRCGAINYVVNDTFARGLDHGTVVFRMHPDHGIPGVINVYVVNSLSDLAGYSFSGAVDSVRYASQFNAIIYSAEQAMTMPSLVPHELGHYFGLYHPSDFHEDLELVDRSNCRTTGDYCCDTQAEYSQMCCPDANCTFINLSGMTDLNGDTLRPDPKNIMTSMQFSGNCRVYFTADQYARIGYYYWNYLSDLQCSSVSPVTESGQNPPFTIYPNPGSGLLSCSLPGAAPDNYTLRIFDELGRLILARQVNGGTGNIPVDMNGRPQGIYICVLESQRGGTTVSKLIITE